MADKQWIAEKFKRFKSGRQAQQMNDQAFNDQLPDWIERFKSDIRELIDALNEQLTNDGRTHVVQVNSLGGDGLELLASGIPFYQITVDRQRRSVAFGFENGARRGLDLVPTGDEILSQKPDGTTCDGTGAATALEDFVDRVMRDLS